MSPPICKKRIPDSLQVLAKTPQIGPSSKKRDEACHVRPKLEQNGAQCFLQAKRSSGVFNSTVKELMPDKSASQGANGSSYLQRDKLRVNMLNWLQGSTNQKITANSCHVLVIAKPTI